MPENKTKENKHEKPIAVPQATPSIPKDTRIKEKACIDGIAGREWVTTSSKSGLP
jgi:hypothetical protein